MLCPPASKLYRKVPVGLITACNVTPLITPRKMKWPALFILKEPAGIVAENVPIWSVTAWVRGLNTGAVLLKMKLVPRVKASVFGAVPKSISRTALKARKGTPGGGGIMPMPTGSLPTGI